LIFVMNKINNNFILWLFRSMERYVEAFMKTKLRVNIQITIWWWHIYTPANIY
jgi:hypothetical protein